MSKTTEMLLALTIKHKGEWGKIYESISKREFEETDNIESDMSYITLMNDNEYPERLRREYQPPFVLFYEGNIDLLTSERKKLAILNSRKANIQKENATISMLLNQKTDTIYIVSSENPFLNQIVDTAEIHNHKVIVVMPYDIYHFSQQGLKQRIIANGGLFITTYPSNAFIDLSNDNFIQVKILMAKLCDKLFVMSCGAKSSDTIAISIALQSNRDILVVPTGIEQTDYENNALIASGAYCVYNYDTLNYELTN